jgi:hypothetical protein
MTAHMRTFTATVLVAVITLLSGCAMHEMHRLITNGPEADFQAGAVQTYRENQDKVLQDLYASAGLHGKEPSDADGWDRVIKAGMDYADVRCEEYLHALFRLNRVRRTTVSQLGLLGGATAGVLGAVEAAAKEIALVAIAFGLAASTVDNLSSGVLYELEPSSVRTIVKGLQVAYRSNIGSYATRPAAVAAIRGYAVLCVPANIEAEVNLALKKAQPQVKPGSNGDPPVATHSEVVLPAATRQQGSTLKDRVDRLLGRIDKLSAAEALALSSIMPFRSDQKYSQFLSKLDPKEQRFVQEKAAREVAKSMIALTANTEDSVARWETVLRQFE